MSVSSTTAPSTPASSSKRHSLNLGPRPLHLVDGNVPFQPSLAGPSTAPLAPTYTSLSSPATSDSSTPPLSSNARKYNSRRQSSISYFTRDNNRDSVVRSLGGVSPLQRSHSAGQKSVDYSPVLTSDRQSTGSAESKEERPPLTLVEKHAELLQFIAQKESKCLELRSQLAVHEAELLQLKRKWERIVSRGFDRINSMSDSSSISTSSQSGPPGQGGAMLEGIKEGVQGVSRFFAAGLNEFSSPTQSPVSHAAASKRRHSTQQSNSSVSTFATNTFTSTHLSQSSASSLGEDSDLPLHTEEDESQVLMVHDTGATPTMSPNPAFMHQQQKEEGLRSSIENGHSSASKMHRRKSRDCSTANLSPPAASLDLADTSAPTSTQVSPVLRGQSPVDNTTIKQNSSVGKRASMNGGALPPAALIPGLGSLTAVGGSVPPVSSWVGSMGKRWEELQRGGTFTKGQKRASLLISDFSQTIASALSSPPLASASYNPALSTTPPSFSPPDSSTGTSNVSSSSAASLLDDDDAMDGLTTHLGIVMTPDSKSASQPPLQPQMVPTKSIEPPNQQDPDDEWNW